MARYEHQPIYEAALDLMVHLEEVVAGFSRQHRYTQDKAKANANAKA